MSVVSNGLAFPVAFFLSNTALTKTSRTNAAPLDCFVASSNASRSAKGSPMRIARNFSKLGRMTCVLPAPHVCVWVSSSV